METGRDEATAERVHLDQGGQVSRVAEIVRIPALGQGRAGCRLNGDHANVAFAAKLFTQVRKGDPGKVRATTGAADYHIGFVLGQSELFHCLQANHRLMQHHVVQHAAQGILRVGIEHG